MQNNNYLSILTKSATGSFAVKISGMGLAFLLQLYLARLLKVDEYGIYIYVLTWMNLLLLIVTHGWDTSTIRYVSEYTAKSKWDLLKGFLLVSKIFTLLSSLLVSGLVLSVVFILEDSLPEYMVSVFVFGCLLLPVNTLLQTTSASIQGMKRVVMSQLPQNMIRPVFFAILLLAATFFRSSDLTASDTMLLNIVSGFLALIFSVLVFRLIMPREISTVSAAYKTKKWFKTALPLLLVSGFIMLMNRLDILMLGAMSTTGEAGIYSVSSRIAELASFGLVVVNAVMAPMIADMYATKKQEELQTLVLQSVLGISLLTLFLSSGVIIFGKEIINLFGEGFESGEMALYILIAGHFVNSMTGSVGFLMTMTGQQRAAATILGSVALINVILNLILIPLYGMEGAAYATAVSMMLWNVLMVMVVRKKVGVYPTVFSVWRLLK